MHDIDKRFIKKSFNASAATYDTSAGLQQRLLDRLLRALPRDVAPAARMLDVGMGTGNLTERLLRAYPHARVFGCDLAENMLRQAVAKGCADAAGALVVAADAEHLPYRQAAFDIAVSSFTYQWMEQLDRAFAGVRCLLPPGGRFIFSVFGRNTFWELRQAYAAAYAATGYTRGRALELTVTQELLADTLGRCGFGTVAASTSQGIERYAGVAQLVRAIKGMGARNASPQRNRTPAVRRVWRRMCRSYEETWGDARGIPATYEVILLQARRR